MNYDKLVAALRCENAQNVAGPDCAEYDCYANRGKGLYCQTAKLLSDAADAIEALQAEIRESMQRCAECGDELAHQMPKRGEWKKWADKHGMTQLVRLVCSECGKDIVVSKENIPNYCPNCGAKMEAQE